jgi:hypothetical protein
MLRHWFVLLSSSLVHSCWPIICNGIFCKPSLRYVLYTLHTLYYTPYSSSMCSPFMCMPPIAREAGEEVLGQPQPCRCWGPRPARWRHALSGRLAQPSATPTRSYGGQTVRFYCNCSFALFNNSFLMLVWAVCIYCTYCIGWCDWQ